MVEKVINVDGKKLYQHKGLKCPNCGGKLTINFTKQNIPYFGETQFIVYYCDKCNYKATDLQPLEKKPPIEQVLNVEGEEDLKIKLVRGSDTTLTIKEIEMSLDPTSNSSGFYSNIESLLLKFKGSAEQLRRHYRLLLEDKPEDIKEIHEGIKKLNDIIQKLEAYLEGNKFTLILRSPKGYGLILSNKAKTELIKNNSETKSLKIEQQMEAGINVKEFNQKDAKEYLRKL